MRSYVEHLLFSVYEHSFAFLIFFFSALCALLRLSTLAELLSFAIPVHVFLALRRTYRKSWFTTSWRFTGIVFVYFIAFAFTMTAAALYAAWHTV